MPTAALYDRPYLPRLQPEYYRGTAAVLWTHTMKDRAVGWLTPEFHSAFREIALHAQVRERLLCPIYCLMPDHFHLVWMGIGPESDQRPATAFLRHYLERRFA